MLKTLFTRPGFFLHQAILFDNILQTTLQTKTERSIHHKHKDDGLV